MKAEKSVIICMAEKLEVDCVTEQSLVEDVAESQRLQLYLKSLYWLKVCGEE